MSRTLRFKFVLFGLLALAIAGGMMIVLSGLSSMVLIYVAAFFLLPGRITGYLWRDLMKGRRMMDAGRHGEAIQPLRAFLGELERKPWLGRLIWISPSVYTVSAKAMALSNLGACWLHLGKLDEAERSLNEAMALDPLYPMPHYNLAAVEVIRRREDQSRYHLEKAHELGFTKGPVDRILDRLKSDYAGREPATQDSH